MKKSNINKYINNIKPTTLLFSQRKLLFYSHLDSHTAYMEHKVRSGQCMDGAGNIAVQAAGFRPVQGKASEFGMFARWGDQTILYQPTMWFFIFCTLRVFIPYLSLLWSHIGQYGTFSFHGKILSENCCARATGSFKLFVFLQKKIATYSLWDLQY